MVIFIFTILQEINLLFKINKNKYVLKSMKQILVKISKDNCVNLMIWNIFKFYQTTLISK